MPSTTRPRISPRPSAVQAICARGTGIGADGIVLLERSWAADFRMLYLNSDGSRADLCGNAALCSVRLAVELGIMPAGECHVETDAGVLSARLLPTGPEVDLQPVAEVKQRLPFRLDDGRAVDRLRLAGVPHLVVRVDDVERVDVVGRGRPLRYDSSLAQGANVNFVSPDGAGGWRIRTYERGVEGETLACGTGAVATADHAPRERGRRAGDQPPDALGPHAARAPGAANAERLAPVAGGRGPDRFSGRPGRGLSPVRGLSEPVGGRRFRTAGRQLISTAIATVD